MAHLLTGIRLLLVVPGWFAFAGLDGGLAATVVALAIATDYYDGVVARARGTASPFGRLFDHTADFLFVTVGLWGASVAGVVSYALPILIVVAFSQYVLDSYFLHRQKQLLMSRLGRWNGILYFAPLVIIALARLPVPTVLEAPLLGLAGVVGWALVVSTLASIADRAVAVATPRRTS